MKKYSLLLLMSFFLVVGCKKDEPKLSITVEPTEVSLFRDGESKLAVKNAEGEITYKSENEFIAKVSNEGVITGKVIGETKVTVTALNGTTTTLVTVNPRIRFIPEPYTGFGNSVETVKSELTKRGDNFTVSENGTIMVKKVIDKSDVIYLYMFESSKLTSSAFACSITSQITSSVIDFYVERYVVASQTGSYSYVGFTPDKKIAVGISLLSDNSIVAVMYFPFNSSSSIKEHVRQNIKQCF
ncbi:MAG TPA: hypothetical protein GXZ87_06805 [Bacteroidales bacterium]|nr:hypothetical protein [Bacteroidales bacterium]